MSLVSVSNETSSSEPEPAEEKEVKVPSESSYEGDGSNQSNNVEAVRICRGPQDLGPGIKIKNEE